MVLKRPMVAFLIQLLLAIRSRFTRRARLEAENLLLRQQLVVLRRKSPARVRLWNIDRLLLVSLYRLYPALLDAIIIVQPETVIRWHRRGFRAYWRWKFRQVGGPPRIDCEMRALIRRMSHENPLWGAPRIHCELLMLGIEGHLRSDAAGLGIGDDDGWRPSRYAGAVYGFIHHRREYSGDGIAGDHAGIRHVDGQDTDEDQEHHGHQFVGIFTIGQREQHYWAECGRLRGDRRDVRRHGIG